MMSGKEKLYFLLDEIDDARAIAPSGQHIAISVANDLNNRLSIIELDLLFTKLEKDEKVLRLLKAPNRVKTALYGHDLDDKLDDSRWHIELLPAFDNYLLKIQQEPEYQEFTGKRPIKVSKPQIKPNRKALEKIWNILQKIEEMRQLSPDNATLSLEYHAEEKNDVNFEDLHEEKENILVKLLDLQAIKDVEGEGKDDTYYFWTFKIGDKYFEVYNEYEETYDRVAKDYQRRIKKVDKLYEITYTPSREIILNKTFQLAKPDFDTENDLVFDYLYKHPNQKFTKQQLEEAIGRKLTKDLHKIVENLGFKSDLRKMFFSVSATSISFKNPITQEDLEALGIQKIKIS